MTRLAPFLLLAAAASVALADGKTVRDDPRPGMRWIDRPPAGAPATMIFLQGGVETTFYVLPPGGAIEVTVEGENRLLVYSRLALEKRESGPAKGAWTWAMDGAAPQAYEFSHRSHRVAWWKGLNVIPSNQGIHIVDVPARGAHRIRFAAVPDATADVMLRFLIEDPVPPSIPRKLKTEGPWVFSGDYRMWTILDDNVWRFGDDDVHAVEERDDNSDRFNNIEINEDWIMINEVEFNIRRPTPAGIFTMQGEVTDRIYLVNHRKNSDTYRLGLKHRFTPTLSYRVFGAWEPDHYVRNFRSADPSDDTFEEVHYDRYTYGLNFWWDVADTATLSFRYAREFRDFNTRFDERDLFAHSWAAGIRWEPSPMWAVDLEWEHVHARARATGSEVDTSYRENGPRLKIDWVYGKVFAGVSYGYSWREYTTRNASSIDPFHADRWDRRHIWKASVGIKAGDYSYVSLEFARRKRTSRLAGDRDSSGSVADVDESLEYDGSSIGLLYEIRFK
jgi:hypothetical protein